jgi:ubiquinone/menaquinone biosynthesis C-methylase UbiE
MTESMPAASWKDHFSHASDDYRRWRPRYPAELFEWLAARCPARDLAWDCATGSGQAAVELARTFRRVVATDASTAQIAEAEPASGVEYLVAPAEQSPLTDASADLVTVAQALHWFDVERFHAEVRRVLRPGGLLAEWGYGLAIIAPPIDALVLEFSAVTVGPYWPPERALVESAYSTVPFPFARLETPEFSMTASWSLDRFVSYIGTWSSVAGYRRAHGNDPVSALREALAPLWGGGERDVRWPLLLRVGRR